VSSFVLDASALLAALRDEPGVENLPSEWEMQDHAVMSTVNLCEVQSKLVVDGIQPDDAWDAMLSAIHTPVALDEEQAKLAGSLRLQTRKLGLSLGDRACIALGLTLKMPIYTADRQWSKLKIGSEIHMIR
jgi:PIN domain nuclease of toxin-antitoxin system